jgi:hypothetical protein
LFNVKSKINACGKRGQPLTYFFGVVALGVAVQCNSEQCASNREQQIATSSAQPFTNFRKSAFVRILIALAAAGVCAFILANCALVDKLDTRADQLNRTFTDYRDLSTLLNIVRASRNEPMNFVVMTGTTGHGTLTGNEGLPTFIVGPGTPAAPVNARNFVFGPNTLSESASNDFNVSVLDDPQSYAALMTPVDIGTIAFFFQEQLSRPLLLPLFVNQIRIIPDGGTTAYQFNSNWRVPEFVYCERRPPQVASCDDRKYYLSDDPSLIAPRLAACQAGAALCFDPSIFIFQYLYENGLFFQAPAGANPSQSPVPYRICYDPFSRAYGSNSFEEFLNTEVEFKVSGKMTQDMFFQTFSDGKATVAAMASLSKANKSDLCDDVTSWIQPPDFSKGTGSMQSTGGGGLPSSLCLNGACAASKTQKATMMAAKTSKFQWAYGFYDRYGHARIEFTTRSARGMYLFLGALVRQQQAGLPAMLMGPGLSDDQDLFKVLINQGAACFVALTYAGVSYCIPTDANNAKTILSLLHELVNLETKPNSAQQPNSSTARITP